MCGLKVSVVLAGALLVSGCGLGKSLDSASENVSATKVMSTFNLNKYPLNKLVCDPFEGPPPSDYTQGVKAKLWYLRPTDPRVNSVASLMQTGVASAQDLFFSQINVPTRLFSLGFPTQTGSMVKDDTGADLVEYFALKFDSLLRLASDDSEGTYELALLSDDGANLYIGDLEGPTPKLVSNDGNHPTRFGCGGTIDMTRGALKKMSLEYYQGPRFHISVIPMWRKVEGARIVEPLCGVTGNRTFFDYDNNSAPQKAYNDLLARGWRPIRAENYQIPSNADFNPCVQGQVPVISNFVVNTIEGLRATWTTDIPASTQLRYVNVATGQEILTVSDNTLTTTHSVDVFDVQAGQTYDVQGVSISDTLGKGLSTIVRVKF